MDKLYNKQNITVRPLLKNGLKHEYVKCLLCNCMISCSSQTNLDLIITLSPLFCSMIIILHVGCRLV